MPPLPSTSHFRPHSRHIMRNSASGLLCMHAFPLKPPPGVAGASTCHRPPTQPAPKTQDSGSLASGACTHILHMLCSPTLTRRSPAEGLTEGRREDMAASRHRDMATPPNLNEAASASADCVIVFAVVRCAIVVLSSGHEASNWRVSWLTWGDAARAWRSGASVHHG